jgi:tetratricopeptide (TPR) repeat protein
MQKKHRIIIFTFLAMGLIMACSEAENKSSNITEAPSDVMSALNDAVKSSRGGTAELLSRARYLFEQSNFDEAVADLFLVLQKDTTHLQAHHLLADVYMETYQSQLALRTMERAANLYPDSIGSLLKLAEFQLILKQYDQSKQMIGKVMALDAQNADGLFLLGLNFKELGETEKAIAAFQSAVEIDPDLTDAWLILGNYMEEINSSLAGQYYDNAVRVSPNNIAALHSKAYYLQNQERIDEAIEIYQQIIEVDSTYADAYLNMGILYILQERVPFALDQFNSLIDVDSTNELAHFYVGRSWELVGDIEKAKEAYQNAIKWSPSMKRAQEALNALDGPLQ